MDGVNACMAFLSDYVGDVSDECLCLRVVSHKHRE